MRSPLSLLVGAALVAGTLQSPLTVDTVDKTKCIEARILPDSLPCGYVNAYNRIKEGTMNNITDFPWTALLFYGDGEPLEPECNGVLISKSFVVTAAHCLIERSQKKKSLTFVRLGEYDLYRNPEQLEDPITKTINFYCTQIDIKPKNITIHPQYEPGTANQYHDIALVELEHPVDYTHYIQPICLPDESFAISANINFTVSGWGLTNHFRHQGYPNIISPVKLKEDLPLFDREKCQEAYNSSQITIGSGQLCAGGQLDKDTCQGDSGSPLMMIVDSFGRSNWVLVGLVSLGHRECGTEGKPGIHTYVKEYVDWITESVGDLPSRVYP